MANYDRYGRDDRSGRGSNDYRGGDYRGRDDDRGFLDRAGDEVRSWFGDRDADGRRDRDGDGYHFNGRDDRYENRSDAGFRGTWGQGAGGQSDDRYRRGATGGSDDYGRRNYGTPSFGASAYGGSSGFDRSEYGERYSSDPGVSGGFGQSDHGRGRTGYGAYSQGQQSYNRDDSRPDYGQADRSSYGARSGAHHDDDYRSWRDRQVASFDRDYEDYRRERQQKFHNEFDTWRTGRTGQTQAEAERNGTQWKTKVREHQEVLGSDGEHVGTVDHVQDDRLKLTKRDGDGEHHYLPFTAIQSVDNAVRLNVSAADARRQWRGETGIGGTAPKK